MSAMQGGTTGTTALALADAHADAGRLEEAVTRYESLAQETVDPRLLLKLARAYEQLGDASLALAWAVRVTETDDFASWKAAAAIVARASPAVPAQRQARLAVLGSYTTSQLVEFLVLAARSMKLALDVYEAPFAQYQQEILDPTSTLYSFEPDFVLLAVDARELRLPAFAPDPDRVVEEAVARWESLWTTIGRSHATVVQHLFALSHRAPFGHLASTLPGTAASMGAAVNQRLALSAPANVAVVDCERLASLVGKRNWFDDRYWYLAKQGVALGAVPTLARHTAAVIAARAGLSKKCIALDLDNTLWGGVVGEEGVTGIALGDSPQGEAYQEFQDYLLALKNRGVVLAVCSKNNEQDAREVFERHPGMRLALDDIAVFVADWRTKPEQLASVAEQLGLGKDALLFVDDNPAEREIVRRLVPEVDVLPLPTDPAGYVDALERYPLLEPAAFTPEDAERTGQYLARAQAAAAADGAETIEDFYRALQMRAEIVGFNETNLPRVAQLVGKTNQFNLTTRRHTAATLEAFAADPRCVHLAVKLADRFADHGLIAVAIAFQEDEVLRVDSWLMSCRVIGRTLEQTVFDELVRAARTRGCRTIEGLYVATPKNQLVQGLYERLGFVRVDGDHTATRWVYELGSREPSNNEFIAVTREV